MIDARVAYLRAVDHALDAVLSRDSTKWSVHDRAEAWRELCERVDAIPEPDVARVVAEIDARLARQYGSDAVWFEDDERVAPARWCLPSPRPGLAIAREVSLDVLAVPHEQLLALASSPFARPITRVSLHGGWLEPILPQLTASELFADVDTLRLRSALIGGDDGAALLARAPALASLAVLDLAGCNVHEEGVEAILASPHLEQLQILDVDANFWTLPEPGEEQANMARRDALGDALEARGIEMKLV